MNNKYTIQQCYSKNLREQNNINIFVAYPLLQLLDDMSTLNTKNQIGEKGEDLATEYLLKRGYEIVCRNWRFKHYEIDIIAKKEPFLIVVEVKTRQSDKWGAPYLAVSKKKQEALVKATRYYLEQFPLSLEVRFDVVSVLYSSQEHQIEHIPSAFYPTVQSC